MTNGGPPRAPALSRRDVPSIGTYYRISSDRSPIYRAIPEERFRLPALLTGQYRVQPLVFHSQHRNWAMILSRRQQRVGGTTVTQQRHPINRIPDFHEQPAEAAVEHVSKPCVIHALSANFSQANNGTCNRRSRRIQHFRVIARRSPVPARISHNFPVADR